MEDEMPRRCLSLTRDDAKPMVQAAEAATTTRRGVVIDIAVVDAGGHHLAFVRRDGAVIGGIDLAIRLFGGGLPATSRAR
jgi:uncharacterized protein GlcG (DUF336 family)